VTNYFLSPALLRRVRAAEVFFPAMARSVRFAQRPLTWMARNWAALPRHRCQYLKSGFEKRLPSPRPTTSRLSWPDGPPTILVGQRPLSHVDLRGIVTQPTIAMELVARALVYMASLPLDANIRFSQY
jgi:hypothetical protein